MAGDVELGDRNAKRIERLRVEERHKAGLREAIEEVLRPLATNIVGDNNVFDSLFNRARQSRRDSIIYIDVPGCGG